MSAFLTTLRPYPIWTICSIIEGSGTITAGSGFFGAETTELEEDGSSSNRDAKALSYFSTWRLLTSFSEVRRLVFFI